MTLQTGTYLGTRRPDRSPAIAPPEFVRPESPAMMCGQMPGVYNTRQSFFVQKRLFVISQPLGSSDGAVM